jgi:hypothetical protein
MRIFGNVRPMAGIGQRRPQTNGMLWVAGVHNILRSPTINFAINRNAV